MPMTEPGSGRLRRIGWGLWIGFCVVIGLSLRAPIFDTGFNTDDYLQLEMLREGGWPQRSPFGLFTFSTGEASEVQGLKARGILPWWSSDQLLAAPMRPVSSLVLWGSYQALGPAPLGLHVVSAVLWAGLVVLVAGLLRFVLARRSPVVSGVALLAYVLAKAHSLPLGWLANQSAVLAAIFSFACLWAHVSWRRTGRAFHHWVSLCAMGLGLLSAEYAVGILGYLVAYELLGAQGSARARVAALAPKFGLFFLYTAAFFLLGYGARGMPLYANPMEAPGLFLQRLWQNVPTLVGDALLGAPGFMHLALFWALLGMAFFWVLLRAIRDPAMRRLSMWLVLGGLLSVVPGAVTVYSSRLLLIPALGVLSGLCLASVDVVQGARSRPIWRTVPMAAIVLLMVLGHGVAAPLASFLEVFQLRHASRVVQEAAVKSPLDARPTVLVAAPDLFSLHYPALVRTLHGRPAPRRWVVLSPSPGHHQLVRVSERELDVIAGGDPLLGNYSGWAYRSDASPLRVGDQFQTEEVHVSVLQAGAPTRLRFRFEQPLDAYHFVKTEAGEYKTLVLPPKGVTQVPPAKPPW